MVGFILLMGESHPKRIIFEGKAKYHINSLPLA
jgi:hypothetical protein